MGRIGPRKAQSFHVRTEHVVEPLTEIREKEGKDF
jgi:hypothetical protein